MPELVSYDYAVIRIVPRVERGEFLNVGVVLFCRTRRYLSAEIAVDLQRLHSLAPELDTQLACEALDLFPRICAGGSDAGAIGDLDPAGRFHWLVSPRSTIIQTSPVHCGTCSEPELELDDLMRRLVLPLSNGKDPVRETPAAE